MTSISLRNSVLAVVPETVQGTAVAPSAATQFTAMRVGFAMSPVTNILTTDEYRSSIGMSKPIPGTERPTVSLSHYLRHSGVEGQAPDYNDLVKAFFGAETVNATERVTAAGSTTTVINVQAGTGAEFPRGSAQLIKDPLNGRRIRAVHSQLVDAITLGFQVPVAPAAGVSLGKCVYYTPANTGHQTLSIWGYLGNGGATTMVSGVRILTFGFTATPGELISADFGGTGLNFYHDPILITSATRYLDFTDSDGTFAAAVEVRAYKDPHELAEAIKIAMDAANPGETHSVEYQDADATNFGKYKFTATGATLSLLFATGANTANTIATKIGFAVADETGNAASVGYYSDTPISFAAPFTPAIDAAEAVAAKNHEVMIGDFDDYACFNAQSVVFSGTLTEAINSSLCAENGIVSTTVTSRAATITIVSELNQYDAQWFRRYRAGTETRFQYSWGVKSGNQWVAGKCGYLYLPTLTVTSWEVTDVNGTAVLTLILTPFVDTVGSGEMYKGYV